MFTFRTELEVACTVYLVLRARKRRPSLYGRAVVRAFTIHFAQSVGVRLESGEEQEQFKWGKDQRSTRLLQMTQSASSYMKNREMLKSAQPLCQRRDYKYSQQLTRLLGTAKYLLIRSSRTHLGLGFGLKIGQ